jgi:hypothetical protein
LVGVAEGALLCVFEGFTGGDGDDDGAAVRLAEGFLVGIGVGLLV